MKTNYWWTTYLWELVDEGMHLLHENTVIQCLWHMSKQNSNGKLYWDSYKLAYEIKQKKMKCEDDSICQINLLCQLKKEIDLELNWLNWKA